MTANQDRRRTGTINAPQMYTTAIELQDGTQVTFTHEKGADVDAMIQRVVANQRSKLQVRGRAKKVKSNAG